MLIQILQIMFREDNVVSFGWIIDNVSCSYTLGCTDPNAFNYDPDAGVDDGSCIDESNQLIGCMDENYLEYDENANINNDQFMYYACCFRMY